MERITKKDSLLVQNSVPNFCPVNYDFTVNDMDFYNSSSIYENELDSFESIENLQRWNTTLKTLIFSLRIYLIQVLPETAS